MTASISLRIASGLTMFLALGHTAGAVLAGPSHGPEEVALREAMRTYRVTEMGMERNYWDFYIGSGWTITALIVASAVVMWLLAPLARHATGDAKRIAGVFAAGYGAITVISLLYFVTAPIVVSAAITACLAAAAFGTTAKT